MNQEAEHTQEEIEKLVQYLDVIHGFSQRKHAFVQHITHNEYPLVDKLKR